MTQSWPDLAPIRTVVGPRAEGPDGRPLLLLLHGYGSNENDLPGIVAHLGQGWDWVSPRGPYDIPGGGAAWFPISVPGRPERGPVEAALAGLLAWLDQTVDGQPVVPIGFSQGGMMVTELLRARPDTFPAGVVLSGFVAPGTSPGDARLAGRKVPLFYGRGAEDRGMIPAEAFERTEDWAREHADATIKVYPGLAHSIAVEELADVAAFLGGLGLDAVAPSER
ncbi:alpha/beta hydrolase [Raineyella antarctica]|nr:alpha/beta fold hydrolase [Raineyella antarctica]